MTKSLIIIFFNWWKKVFKKKRFYILPAIIAVIKILELVDNTSNYPVNKLIDIPIIFFIGTILFQILYVLTAQTVLVLIGILSDIVTISLMFTWENKKMFTDVKTISRISIIGSLVMATVLLYQDSKGASSFTHKEIVWMVRHNIILILIFCGILWNKRDK